MEDSLDAPSPIAGVTIATALRQMRSSLSKSELKVAAVLLSNYPVAGLVNISSLARKAGVSDPTVTRLVNKLGFDGFASFKAALQQELEARLMAPTQVEPQGIVNGVDTLSAAAALLSGEISRSFVSLSVEDVELAVELLADLDRKVLMCGGRISSLMARVFAWSLEVLRPGVTMIGEAPAERTNRLLDIDASSLIVAFDFRRYQIDTVEFVRSAVAQGAKAILFTDPYLSPAAGFSDVVLHASINGVTPFNSMTSTLALVETVLSLLIPRLGEDARSRMKHYVEISEGENLSDH